VDTPHISPPILLFFRRIVRGYFRRHFRAVRIFNAERFSSTTGPLIVYANHSSWWDPMVSVLLADRLMPARSHFAPMDAAALARYGILKRIGIFGVEMHSLRGAARFLRTGLDLLARNSVLWITPQGRFVDPRQRPLVFKPGLAALASRVPRGCTVLPLAIEYPFWDERLPETLLEFGTPVFVEPHSDPEAVEGRLKSALLDTMESLQLKAIARDPAAFELLHTGHVGTGGFYEFGQRLLARLHRRPYQPEHTALKPQKEQA
jgi:1-acyl-sn-glycerol-3-phosphate acyltransferase